MNDNSTLWPLLKSTSRSFYLTLRVLPPSIRPQIGLAYLLARATDTIADTQVIPVARRLECLGALRDRVKGGRNAPLDFREWLAASAPSTNASSAEEQALLFRIEQAIHALRSFSPSDQGRVARVIDIITQGQALDLERFGFPEDGSVRALQSSEQLSDYTYRVAGCVGEFWTQMCEAHLIPPPTWEADLQAKRGVRFGQGLQLVNILRDLPRDLQQGRCYLPEKELVRQGLAPRDLRDPRQWQRLRPIYERHWTDAQDHLEAGWCYTLGVPRRQRRVRLACAMPVLIGLQTLRLLGDTNPLDPRRRIKVSRSHVRATAAKSLLAVWGLYSWEKLHHWAKG